MLTGSRKEGSWGKRKEREYSVDGVKTECMGKLPLD